MNTATVIAQPLENTATAGQQAPSIWRRMFAAWVRSYDARISPDGTVMYVGL